MPTSIPPGHRPSQLDLTEQEFERRLARAGHGELEIRRLWSELAAGDGAVTGERRLAVGALVAIYLGGLLVIAAFGLLLGQYWETLDPWGVLVIGSAYLAGFLVAGEVLRSRRMLQPAGLLQTVGVCFVAGVAYAVERIVGLWPEAAHDLDYVHRGWTVIAIVTIAAGVAMLAVRPFPLLVVPVAAGAIVLAQDVAELLFGNDVGDNGRAAVMLPVGLAALALGLALDVRKQRMYAMLVHVAGLGLAGVALVILMPTNVLGYGVIGVLGAASLFFSLFVRHWSFAVAGGFGIFLAVTGAIDRYAEGSASIVVSTLGVLFIVGGLAWNAYRERVRAAFLARVPARVREFLEQVAP